MFNKLLFINKSHSSVGIWKDPWLHNQSYYKHHLLQVTNVNVIE